MSKKFSATIKRILSPLPLLLLGIVIGTVSTYYIYPTLISYKGLTLQKWSTELTSAENDATKSRLDLISCNDQLASASAQVATLLARPTPKPQVVYETQTEYVPTQPKNTTTNCTSDYAGGMNCYSSDGSQKHCTSNYAGGMYCY